MCRHFCVATNPPGPLALRLVPAHLLLDRLAAAPSWAVRIKHERYRLPDVELLRMFLCHSVAGAYSDAVDGMSRMATDATQTTRV
ncbi:hypothetical protein EDB86DRAFT_2954059 [Lactarius hatsudake]|nr:hypothetical protein EDB86DRAFT_2954059 [Lactarius hatsudake]